MRKLDERRLLVATHNAGKLDEMRALFAPYGIEVVGAAEMGLAEPEETEATFVGNARIKAAAAVKDLEDQQKARAKRLQRDAIDRALTELTGFYRDLLSVQTGAGAPLINDDLGPKIAVMARSSTPEATLHKIDALLACREALEGNVAPLLAVESTLIGLARR